MRFRTIANFNALVEVHENQVVTDSRKVAEVFGKEHKHVLESIRQILAAENSATNFFCESVHEYRGQQFPMYYLNRDGFSLLVMGFTGKKALEWKLKYIEAFNAMEKKLSQPLSLEQQMAQGLLAAQKMLEAKEQQIIEMTPKALFADAVSASKTSILVGELAKLIKQNGHEIGQKRLFAWMREHGYLMKTGSSKNLPTQRSMEMKLFEIKETTINNPDGSIRITKTPKVTGKGQLYFINKFTGAVMEDEQIS